jgi:hypothetical protein
VRVVMPSSSGGVLASTASCGGLALAQRWRWVRFSPRTPSGGTPLGGIDVPAAVLRPGLGHQPRVATHNSRLTVSKTHDFKS